MSVELPPLPEPFDNDRYFRGDEECRFDLFTADQLRAYATEALAAQSAELAECKEAYALLFKENARLREEVEKRKPLSEAELLACVRESRDMTMYEFARAIERAHGIGKQE